MTSVDRLSENAEIAEISAGKPTMCDKLGEWPMAINKATSLRVFPPAHSIRVTPWKYEASVPHKFERYPYSKRGRGCHDVLQAHQVLDPQASSADVLAAVVFKSQVVLAGQRHEGDCGKHTGRNYEQGFFGHNGPWRFRGLVHVL